MTRALLALAALALTGCYQSHERGEPSSDAGADSSLPPDSAPQPDTSAPSCPSGGRLEDVSGMRLEPPPDAFRPSASLHRVLADPATERFVVAVSQTGPAPGFTLSLMVVDREGRVERVVVLSEEYAVDQSFDVAPVPGGWRVVGSEVRSGDRMEWTEVWTALVTSGGELAPRVELAREEAGAVRQLRVAPRSDGSFDVYTVRADRQVYVQLLDGEALGGATPIGVTLDPESTAENLAVVRDGATTCLAVQAFPRGTGWSVRLEDGVLAETSVFAERGLAYAPVPDVRGGECVLAWFEGDPRYPTRGRVRLSGVEGGALGWGGTHPLGVALLPGEAAVALAVPSPTVPRQVDVHVVQLGGSSCSVQSPTLTRGAAAQPVPLGALSVGALGDDVLIFEAGLAAEGVLSAVRLVRD